MVWVVAVFVVAALLLPDREFSMDFPFSTFPAAVDVPVVPLAITVDLGPDTVPLLMDTTEVDGVVVLVLGAAAGCRAADLLPEAPLPYVLRVVLLYGFVLIAPGRAASP